MPPAREGDWQVPNLAHLAGGRLAAGYESAATREGLLSLITTRGRKLRKMAAAGLLVLLRSPAGKCRVAAIRCSRTRRCVLAVGGAEGLKNSVGVSFS